MRSSSASVTQTVLSLIVLSANLEKKKWLRSMAEHFPPRNTSQPSMTPTAATHGLHIFRPPSRFPPHINRNNQDPPTLPPTMPPKPKLNVYSFPRPPLCEKTPRHLQIKWKNQIIADTKDAYWVLETTHPPSMFPHLPPSSLHQTPLKGELNKHSAYYLPPASLSLPLFPSPHTSFCEWKGPATYHHIADPSTNEVIKNKIWSYDDPTPAFRGIKGYLSFYANAPWECYVDGEKVEPQEGDFYGGWVTNELEGRMKGGAGTWGW